MPNQKSVISILAEDILRKFPKEPSLSLARKLYKENKDKIQSLNAAYAKIRYLRGTNGVHNRKHANRPSDIIDRPACSNNSLAIPNERQFVEWTPYTIEGSEILCISDLHFPWHDKKAIEISLSDAKDRQVDTIFINGDLVDSYSLSKFPKDPTKPRFSDEIFISQQFFAYVRQEFPKVRIYWKFGNHDLSLEKYVWNKAPELFGVPGTDLENLVRVGDYKVDVIKHNRPVFIGKLTALHGHEWGGGSIGPVNPARGAFLKLNESAIISHYHKSSQHSETTLHDKLITCWSIGCLCKLHPEYARVNKWNFGYAIVSLSKDGDYEVDNRRIYHGRSW